VRFLKKIAGVDHNANMPVAVISAFENTFTRKYEGYDKVSATTATTIFHFVSYNKII